ncbi:hypothetical protein [Kordia jejudonensis]|uniref:hypothetical protein n=1 Tax=Kordia jejudonensis TaxID=1348245 RepID=UPI000629CD5C|nr:hypothetical protein [Kordia jejudonensis]
MKKKSLKNLSLNKKSISLLGELTIKGGNEDDSNASYFSCITGICKIDRETDFCNTWWGCSAMVC